MVSTETVHKCVVLYFFQSAEEVDFSGNGITASGLKAFDGILQKNTILKTLNLSGNAIGDEGAKVTYQSFSTQYFSWLLQGKCRSNLVGLYLS